jgi:hypothetical protein
MEESSENPSILAIDRFQAGPLVPGLEIRAALKSPLHSILFCLTDDRTVVRAAALYPAEELTSMVSFPIYPVKMGLSDRTQQPVLPGGVPDHTAHRVDNQHDGLYENTPDRRIRPGCPY